jgi:hypothetical protein
VLQHLADLWGYDVVLNEVDRSTGAVLREHRAAPGPCSSDGARKADARASPRLLQGT